MSHQRILDQQIIDAYKRGEVRYRIKQMGHPLPDPADPEALARVQFDDAIFRLLRSRRVRRHKHLSVLPGGLEGHAGGGTHTGVQEGQPPRVVRKQPEGHLRPVSEREGA